jgi:acyl-CoA synthetase (AMP-forming)/AMP-acid ligase II
VPGPLTPSARRAAAAAGWPPCEPRGRGLAAPAATAEAFTQDGWLRTGDIGILDTGGNLRITDRIKDIFIVGGFNAYPAEIENMISRHPDVARIAVVGVPDERLGEVGFAYVIPRQDSTLTEAGLIAWCRGETANFKGPAARRVRPGTPAQPQR